MVFASEPRRRGPIDLGLGGPVPRDVLAILIAVVVTFSVDAFQAGAALLDLLRMSREIWASGHLWRLVTYPFVSRYGSGLGLILALWMLFIFARPVFYVVGRKAFWRHLLTTTFVAGAIAVFVQFFLDLLGWNAPFVVPFSILSGEWILLTIFITGFAVFYGQATIYLFFVLPVKASWFIGIEVFFAFLAFLASKDFAGFVGMLTAIGVAYFLFSGRNPKRFLHEMKLRWQKRRMEAELRRLRRGAPGGSGKDDGGGVVQGPWVN